MSELEALNKAAWTRELTTHEWETVCDACANNFCIEGDRYCDIPYSVARILKRQTHILRSRARAAEAQSADLAARVKQLEAALTGMLHRYIQLVDSGDCGTWEPDGEPEVKAARAALEAGR